MASKSEHIALEAVRYFKSAQLSAWVGDEQAAADEYEKCGIAIAHFRENNAGNDSELKALDEIRKVAPRKFDERITQVEKEEVVTRANQMGSMTYTLIPLGSSRAEFRARISLRREPLPKPAHTKDEGNVFDYGAWRWIDVNIEGRFTGSFLLTYADKTVYAQITMHDFINDGDALDKLRNSIARAVAKKLQLSLR